MNILKQISLFKKFYLNSRAANGPEKQQEFAMHLEDVDIEAYNRRLQASVFDSKVIQTVGYDNKDFRIFQLDWGRVDSNKRLLILAGVHGNEIAGSLAVLDILEDIQQHVDQYKDWSVRIVAPVNPVGVVCQSRYDQNGYDLNRDFKDFHTVGARLQRDVVTEFKPTIVVTMHESPDEGFYMFSEGKLSQTFKQSIADTLTKANIPLAKTNFLHMKLKNGMWEKPKIIFALQRILGIYTLGRYLYEHNIPTLTTESTWSEKDMLSRRIPHMLVVRAILKT